MRNLEDHIKAFLLAWPFLLGLGNLVLWRLYKRVYIDSMAEQSVENVFDLILCASSQQREPRKVDEVKDEDEDDQCHDQQIQIETTPARPAAKKFYLDVNSNFIKIDLDVERVANAFYFHFNLIIFCAVYIFVQTIFLHEVVTTSCLDGFKCPESECELVNNTVSFVCYKFSIDSFDSLLNDCAIFYSMLSIIKLGNQTFIKLFLRLCLRSKKEYSYVRRGALTVIVFTILLILFLLTIDFLNKWNPVVNTNFLPIISYSFTIKLISFFLTSFATIYIALTLRFHNEDMKIERQYILFATEKKKSI